MGGMKCLVDLLHHKLLNNAVKQIFCNNFKPYWYIVTNEPLILQYYQPKLMLWPVVQIGRLLHFL